MIEEIEPHDLLALEEIQRGKQKATGDLFTVIYEKNGALNRTAISREAKKYLSKVGYLEFEFIVHNSEQNMQ
ncbi:hypothetical protein EA74_01275 [Enterococcus hirae]|uniref:Uncharacterized protein n=1 Tax=Enterococcus hirae TaxID=1354 RepID=A0AB37IJG3_ENTHR|nr:hypothetical protein [Enterococcus hirae]RBT53381.1 hypothetical protein EA74_01275 [Enterococcus hirae]RBT70519.1 hypothetical protein EB03_00385 [Enterococcus hirae]